jgi:hypothetical protein
MTVTPESLHNVILALNRASGLHGGKPLNALGTVVQCWHETGGFSSRPMNTFHNLAGISCTPSWVNRGGKCFSGRTWEHLEGKDLALVKGFRAYPSLASFLEDYSRLIAHCYMESADNPDCVFGFLQGLQNGSQGRHWATDPHYTQKLFALVPQLAPSLLGADWRTTLDISARIAVRRGVPREELSAPSWTGHL